MRWRDRMETAYFQKKESDSLGTIRELRERGKPVYIYGAGTTANRIAGKLTEAGIDVCGYFVDNDFFRRCKDSEENYPIFTFDYVMELPEADVVVGFYQFGIAYSKIEKGKFYNRGKVYFINPEPLFDYEYYLDNKVKFEQTYDWLADDLSRDTMRAYMDGRMNGVMRPMAECYVPDQYFIPEIQFGSDEVYIDCGMYDGDTVEEFIRHCPDYARIIGFEPDEANIEKFGRRNLPMERIEVHCAGVWSKETVLGFSADGTSASRIVESGEESLSVMSIDSLDLKQPVTFIKMDIEGSELEALKGARKTIQRDMPKLAICIYHKKEDMITIPQYIRSLEPEGSSYDFYLRHHSLYEHETVFYAIPSMVDKGEIKISTCNYIDNKDIFAGGREI